MKKLYIISIILCVMGAAPWSNAIMPLPQSSSIPGGSTGQVQYNNSGAFGGVTFSANCFLGYNASEVLACYTNPQFSDSAAQFYSATASKGTLKLLLSGSTDGKLLTTSFLHTDNKTLYFPDPTTGDSVTYGSAAIRLNTGAATARVKTVSDAAATIVEYGQTGSGAIFTTGNIQGGVVIASDADGMNAAAMTAAGVRGTMFIATGAGTWILPTAVGGESLCLMDSGTAHDLILDVTAGDTMRLKGTEGADGVGITNAAGSTTGDFVCVIAVAANKWSSVGMGGTWASQ